MATTTRNDVNVERATTSGRHHPTEEQIWKVIRRSSFAVLSFVTPSGEPRSSGVVYEVVERRMFVAVDPAGWKARHIAANGRVAVTVTVRRGGVLSVIAPIPPATISFPARATVFAPGAPEIGPILDRLGSLLPGERRTSAAIIEIVPETAFVTYAIGVPLRKMRDVDASRARVAVT